MRWLLVVSRLSEHEGAKSTSARAESAPVLCPGFENVQGLLARHFETARQRPQERAFVFDGPSKDTRMSLFLPTAASAMSSKARMKHPAEWLTFAHDSAVQTEGNVSTPQVGLLLQRHQRVFNALEGHRHEDPPGYSTEAVPTHRTCSARCRSVNARITHMAAVPKKAERTRIHTHVDRFHRGNPCAVDRRAPSRDHGEREKRSPRRDSPPVRTVSLSNWNTFMSAPSRPPHNTTTTND